MKDTSSSSIVNVIRNVEEIIQTESEAAASSLINSIRVHSLITKKLNVAVATVSEDEIGLVCDEILGLPEGTNSTINDILICRVNFDAVVKAVQSDSLDSISMTGEVFYAHYMESTVRRTWELLCCHQNQKYNINTTEIGTTGALHLFDLKWNVLVRRPFLHCQSFHGLYQYLKQFWEFLYTSTNLYNKRLMNQTKLFPTEGKVKEFLDQYNKPVATNKSPTAAEVETELRKLLGKKHNLDESELTFQAFLKNCVPSAELGVDGRVIMTRKDQTIFKNSVLFATMVHTELVR